MTEPGPVTAAGRALKAWADSDARSLTEFGYDAVADVIVVIEAEASRAVIERVREGVEGLDRTFDHGQAEYDPIQREIGWEIAQDDVLALLDTLTEGE